MNDASETYARQIEAARVAVSRGDRSTAVETLRAAIETTRGTPELHREHAAALVRLAVLEQELGQPAEAERNLTEAVAIGERNLGADHPSLKVALNELSRLHIRQADFSRAEPVLKRLLHIACGKGDRHPDVATALAGLAVAKRGLGEAAAAEVLYRHALRIREEVLAPDHMAIVITLEQLSETCATRGNVEEAIALLQRALAKRESALGIEHGTVGGLRARIADLERRMSKSLARPADRVAAPPTRATVAAPASAVAPMLADAPSPGAPSPGAPSSSAPSEHAAADWRVTPARPRFFASTATQPQPQRAGELKFLYQPIPAASRPSRPTADRVPTPAASAAVVASSTSDPLEMSPRARSVTLAPTAPADQASTLAHAPASAIRPIPEIADAPATGTPSRDISTLFSSMKRAVRHASAGAAVIALAIAGFDFGSSDPNDSDNAPNRDGAASHTTIAAPPATSHSPTTFAVSAEAAPSEPRGASIATATQPTSASETPPTMPGAAAAVTSLRRLVVPKVAMSSLDSLMGTGRMARDVESEPITVGGSLLTPARNDDGGIIPPVLVSAPTLRFPDELRAQRVDGEVVVQFRVNDKGRVDASSMQVMQSRHELFTAAVRNALPKFRFEPAHSAAPGAKPQSAWVQFRAEFTARN